jgi:hypothetical protein
MRAELAELARTSKQSVSRSLAQFIERGWIVTTTGGFEILHPGALGGPVSVHLSGPRAGRVAERGPLISDYEETRPVVVGIDFSDAALTAAQWAVDEVVDRQVPLRLVHTTGVHADPSTTGDS